MERLFTSIPNAGMTATQNKNIMQTGLYAGEREDYMRENLFMTETTMTSVKIALDHGWSSIKGEHTFMETSVVPVDYTPLMLNCSIMSEFFIEYVNMILLLKFIR